MTDLKKITAVVTTYGREWKTVKRALDSIVNQTYPVYEILLIDDNSYNSPKSETIRKSVAAYERVTYISMICNSGVSAARNRAISAAQGEYIAFLDDDDEWCKEKMEEEISLFERYANIGLSFGTSWIHNDSTGEKTHCWQWKRFCENPTVRDEMLFDRIGSASSPLIKLEVIKQAGGFRVKKMPAVEDYELWIRISRICAIRGIKKPLFIRHMDNSSHLSTNRKISFDGFCMIYHVNREEYKKDVELEAAILKSICREGVKARDIRVFPFLMRWFIVIGKGTVRNRPKH